MSRWNTALAALMAGTLALGAAAADAQTPASPCPVPHSGFQSCLRVLYTTGDNGEVDDVRMTATLLRRVERCPARTAKRRLTITGDDGTRLERVLRRGSCRRKVVRWRAAFSTGETADWGLRQGDTVRAAWRGVRNRASVRLDSGE